MKKLYTTLLMVGLSIPVFAATTTPIATTDKQAYPFPQFSGVSTCEISNATGTTQLSCSGSASIILDIIGSSVATTDALWFRDNSTANITSPVIYSVDQKSLVGAHVFPRFKNGIDVNATVAPTAIGTARPSWTIVYIKDLY